MSENKIFENLVNKYEENIGIINKAEGLLDKYNPWTKEKIGTLSKCFFNSIIKNDNNFSWLKVDEKLLDLPEPNEINTKYGIPTHLHGDIENATLFLCLVNPNIEIESKENGSIRSFYEKASNIVSEDKSLKVLDLDGNINLDTLDIEKYIIDTDSKSSILYSELKSLRNKTKNCKNIQKDEYGYYLKTYFPQFIISCMNKEKQIQPLIKNLSDDEWNSLEKIAEKIVNIEAIPFRSKNPGITSNVNKSENSFANKFLDSHSDVNLLSARIIIWRIVKYLNSVKEKSSKPITRPVFIFRRFNNAWLPSLKYVIKNDLKYTNEDTDELIKAFHKFYFFTTNLKDDNGRSGYIGRRLFKDDILLKDNEFDELVNKTLN